MNISWKRIGVGFVTIAILEIIVYAALYFYVPHIVLARFREAISSEEIIQKIIAEDPSFKCLREKTTCTSGAPIRLEINNAVFYDPADDRGFNLFGKPCAPFDAVIGNLFCPLRVDLFWLVACTESTGCDNYKVRFRESLQHKTPIPFLDQFLDKFSTGNEFDLELPTVYKNPRAKPTKKKKT